MLLTIDNRDGVQNIDTAVSNVDEKAALLWLKKLDGEKHTLLTLERGDGSIFMIGGGPTDYVVTLSTEDQNMSLFNATGDSLTPIEVCAGGQYGEFPQSIVCSMGQADKAVVSFFAQSELQLEWV